MLGGGGRPGPTGYLADVQLIRLLSLKNMPRGCGSPGRLHRSSCGSDCVPHLRGSELRLVEPVLGAGCLVPTRPGSAALVTGCGWGHSPPRKKLFPPSLCSVELFAQRPPGEVSRLTPARRSPLSGMGTGPPCPGTPALAQETLPSLSCGPSRALVRSSEASVTQVPVWELTSCGSLGGGLMAWAQPAHLVQETRSLSPAKLTGPWRGVRAQSGTWIKARW